MFDSFPTVSVHKSFISHCLASAEILETGKVSRWQILNEIIHSFALKAKQKPGDQYEIVSGCQQMEEEKKDDVEDSREDIEHEDQEEEDSYSFHNSPDNLYASIPDDLEENRRDFFFCKRPPPPPPRNLPGILRQDNLHNLSQGTVLGGKYPQIQTCASADEVLLWRLCTITSSNSGS